MSVIYVLKHPDNPAVCKIGESGVGAKSRTSYQGINWIVHKEFPIAEDRRRGAEKFILRAFQSSNVNIGGGAREIFTTPPKEAATRVEQLLKDFLSKISSERKDDDYWRYVATPFERQKHEDEIARERARDEAKQAERDRIEQLRQRNDEDKQSYGLLKKQIREEEQEGWFAFLPLILISGGMFIPAALVVGAGCSLVGCSSNKSENLILAVILAVIGAVIFLTREHDKLLKSKQDTLASLEKDHVIRCPSCDKRLWKDIGLDSNRRYSCPSCKSRIDST